MTRREYRRTQGNIEERAAWTAAKLALIALLAGLLLALLVIPARAEAPSPQSSPTRGEDKKIEQIAVLAAFAAVDYGQSCEMFYGRSGYYELNPVLGARPSRGDMLAFGAAGVGLVWLAGRILPEPWATIVADSAITSERMNVEWNRMVQNGQARPAEIVPVVITWRW